MNIRRVIDKLPIYTSGLTEQSLDTETNNLAKVSHTLARLRMAFLYLYCPIVEISSLSKT